ncbi:hypothetical protein [Amnibacterium endophyticum]|uniref:Uncharacterized protein n=1 Tax=Amnibacterium endophyticum TaxID=2109337 RepID=A0ABW4LCA8_9MICO
MIAANGFISLFTGAEVLPVPQAGPLALPVGVALAAVLLAVRAARATASSVLLPLELLLIGYLVPVVGAALVALLSGPEGALLTAGRLAISWFSVAAAVLAAIEGLVVLLLVRAADAGADRPRWPWEGRDEP